MTAAWASANERWHHHFEPLGAMGYQLERTNEDNYWSEHEKHLRPHFPLEAIIALERLRTEAEQRGQEQLVATRGANPLRDFCFVKKDGELAAVFAGEQRTRGTYRMWHSNVHPDHRRRGIYRQILASTIGYTAALGFDTIVSEHAPGNNPILIAKLQAGFRITALEIDAGVGTSVVLRYFHNPDHLAAYEFRCGLATVNGRILRNSYGAMSELVAQFRGAADGDDSTTT